MSLRSGLRAARGGPPGGQALERPIPLSPRTRVHARLAAIASCIAVVLLASPAAALDVLVVVKDAGNLGVDDDRIVAQLELLDLTPVLVSENSVTAGDATGKDLVFVSASVSASAVGNTFETTAIPVVVSEAFIYDDMGMTGSGGGVGTTANQTEFSITGSHPLTAGLSGDIVFSQTDQMITWGIPAVSAAVAATEQGNSTHASIFGYESGAAMVSGTAPARRVGFSLAPGIPFEWTADMQQLFNAAIEWALGLPITSRVRVQPFGDSITQGILGFTSYRVPLFSLLQDDECRFDFVGSRYEDHGVGPFDANHQGRTTWRTDQLEAALPGWLEGNRPDVVLMFAGTNDVLQGYPTNDIDQNLRDIIGIYRTAEPNVTILLAQIIPNLPENDAAVLALNAAIAQIAIDLDTPASPVVLVDQYTGYDPMTLTSGDMIHPNAQGDAHIAGVWADTLIPTLGAPVCPGGAIAVPAGGASARGLLALLVAAVGIQVTRRRRHGSAHA